MKIRKKEYKSSTLGYLTESDRKLILETAKTIADIANTFNGIELAYLINEIEKYEKKHWKQVVK